MSDRDIYNTRWRLSKDAGDGFLDIHNDYASSFASYFYLNYCEITTEIINARLGPIDGLRIVEVGVGRGTVSGYLASKFDVRIEAFDYSDEAVFLAAQNLKALGPKVSVKLADLHDLPLADESVDVYLSYGVFEHVQDLTSAYNEAARVLVPGGLFISMNVPDKKSIQDSFDRLNAMLKFIYPGQTKKWLDQSSGSKTGGVFRWDESTDFFSSVLKQSGFLRVETFPVNPFPTIEPLPKYIARILIRLFEAICAIRKVINSQRHPFICKPEISRAHILVGQTDE